MQLPVPTPPPSGLLREFLTELLDAKWAITTLLATYAAVLSTFNVFFQGWWAHRARLRVTLTEMTIVDGLHRGTDVLMIKVGNRGYEPRHIVYSLYFDVREIQRQRGRRNVHHVVLSPECDPKLPLLLQPLEAAQLWAKRSEIQKVAAKEGLTGTIHLRAFVSDGVGNSYPSGWLALPLGSQKES
jgi:hypothetical protein